jgi:hypothetical protein
MKVIAKENESIYSWSDIPQIEKKKKMIIFTLSAHTQFCIPAHWFGDKEMYNDFYAQVDGFANQNMEPTWTTPVGSGNV